MYTCKEWETTDCVNRCHKEEEKENVYERTENRESEELSKNDI